MSLQLVVPWLVAAMLTSIAGMVISARSNLALPLVLSAAVFVTAALAAAMYANRNPRDTRLPAHITGAAQGNARLSALVYTWAALSLHALYVVPLVGLVWRHGWQYGTGSALLAAGAFLFARSLDGTRTPTLARILAHLIVPLSAAQALLAACGLAYLLALGKLASARADWAAHVVLASTFIAIIIISALALYTHMRLACKDGVSGA
jgi:hypothetical protein